MSFAIQAGLLQENDEITINFLKFTINVLKI